MRVKQSPAPETVTIETKRKQIVTSRRRQEDEMHALALELAGLLLRADNNLYG